ncbi:MAG: hypothetical protein OQL07_01195, partial [Gammaproteobacteria bacterium]|nr:hypothetical protein [Gammaproteobacteria bacterium]
CPQGRTGNEASQAMLISGANRMSRISSCLAAAQHFQLTREAAISIVEEQVRVIVDNWEIVCDEANLTLVDRAFFWGRQFLNPYAFTDLDPDAKHLKRIPEIDT